MIKFLILSSLISMLTFSNPADTISSEGWKLVKVVDGITLYNRVIPGYKNKEVKAVLEVKTDLPKAKHYLMKPENIEKWMSGCSMSVGKGAEGSKRRYYAIFDAPWPVSDRDDYGQLQLREDKPDRLRIDFRSIPTGTPEVQSLVRVPFSKGHVVIEIGSNGKKTLVYQMLVDRGGNLPSYLKDYLENTSPVKTVHQLKLVLETLQ